MSLQIVHASKDAGGVRDNAPPAPSPLSTHPEGVEGPLFAPPGVGAGERDDDYCGVVALIDPASRIIRCRSDFQFIAQRRRTTQQRSPWQPISYFVTGAGAARLPEPFRSAALALFGEVRP
ncbi:MAG: hypothetical protein BWX69_03062 [Planctomycetes bacterium ADurb.Bin069]|nr:MAG: hypothetical protein BWX69_03062 [Planctomycetes bacterium ADurb.Bin069]